ncbi:YhgE/Pip domain-containing protein [Nocardia yamanashiensis]|uniref:YhgE/Pip domain-containing protein n=1 Tax=Nocardia yamanashiensis TaxID=209247 RepID=UPI0022B8140A|nr:YhgE/Pip domain-containing protein [Nocardia yamanashiensis]
MLRKAPASRAARVFVVLVLVVPTLVSAVYMWIMWDPELYLKRIPVAVASDDLGAISEGKAQNMGAEILDSLVSGGDLQFHRVSSAEAVRGLRESRYAFSVVIPADFTRNVLSVTDPVPQRARIAVWYNDFNGTLGPAVANSVVTEAQGKIAATIGKGFAGQILVGVNSLGSGLGEASQGANQLAEGTTQLADGARQLSAGLDEAATGGVQLAAGAGELRTGAAQLADGGRELVTGTDQLGSGATQIRDGVDQILTPLLEALEPAGKLAGQLDPLLEQLARNSDPAVAEAVTQLRSLVDQMGTADPNSLVGQLTQLRDGTKELARQLTDPQADYRVGILALADGANQLRDGTVELGTGATELSAGLTQLAAGGHELRDGVTQLDDGAAQLGTGLRDGSAAAPHIADTEASADVIAQPITMDIRNQQPSQVVRDGDRGHKEISRGAGPLLVVMGTFLAAIVLWMLLRPIRGTTTGRAPWQRAATPILRATAIGTGAVAVVAACAAAYGSYLGWSPRQWPAMALVIALIAVVAAVTAQLFVVLFGRVAGSIAAFAFYMFQVFAFGGVFPAGTTPMLFRPFENIAPMTYARRAVIRADLALYDTMFWTSIAVLVIMLAAALALMAGVRYLRDADLPRDSARVSLGVG